MAINYTDDKGVLRDVGVTGWLEDYRCCASAARGCPRHKGSMKKAIKGVLGSSEGSICEDGALEK